LVTAGGRTRAKRARPVGRIRSWLRLTSYRTRLLVALIAATAGVFGTIWASPFAQSALCRHFRIICSTPDIAPPVYSLPTARSGNPTTEPAPTGTSRPQPAGPTFTPTLNPEGSSGLATQGTTGPSAAHSSAAEITNPRNGYNWSDRKQVEGLAKWVGGRQAIYLLVGSSVKERWKQSLPCDYSGEAFNQTFECLVNLGDPTNSAYYLRVVIVSTTDDLAQHMSETPADQLPNERLRVYW
jgi:hypothetical protein